MSSTDIDVEPVGATQVPTYYPTVSIDGMTMVRKTPFFSPTGAETVANHDATIARDLAFNKLQALGYVVIVKTEEG